ncbi:filamentous hemagglutinin N-terminal domain-containing protein [Sphingomonas sp. Sphisp140]|uniref:two-partner secretion domain-containing protein n=1 Tax=unclassified Sphingomonas TaxID=196159 RepID=UPI0039B1015C
MLTTPAKARAARSSTLRALALSTALAGGMTLMPGMARAQNNTPGGQTVVTPTGAGAPTFNGGTGNLSGNATNLDVDLRAQSTIINWDRFNIAQGSRVNFETGLAGEVAVLNRVTGTGASNIRGALNSDPNVSVFLVNPNGIMISGTGSVSTGSFVASTRDISNSDFLAGTYQFSGNGSGDITVNGSIATRGTGIGLILLGRQVISNGTLDSGTQDTALVAADDVTLNFTPGSPLGIQITRGTNMSQAMQIVGGTIQGRNVYFAMATRGSATNSLLQVDANVRAVAGDKGIVIVGGQSSIDADIRATGVNTNNSVGVRVGGTLTYQGGAGNAGVHIGGTSTVTVEGTVSSQGDYKVRGPSVVLGKIGSTILQRANGAVSVVAYDGDISGIGSLLLEADGDGGGGQALVLDADDDIDFGTGTTLKAGGAGLASAVNIFTGDRSANIRLGDVEALTLDGGLSGGALEGKLSRAAFLGNGGDITLGTVTLGGAATIEADDLTLTSLTAAGTVTLEAANALRAGAVASNGGAVMLDATTLTGETSGTRASVSAAGTVDIDVDGSALLGTVRSTGGAVTLDAGSFDASNVQAVTGATLTSHNGNARLGGLSVTNGTAALNAEDDAFVVGNVSVSGDYSVIGDAVTLGGGQQAGGAVTVTARSGPLSNSGVLGLTSNVDGVGTEALTLRGRMTLGATTTLNGGIANQSAVVIDTNANNDINLGNINGASLSIAGGAPLTGDLVLGNVSTTAALDLVSSASITTGNLSSGGQIRLQAPVLDTRNINSATNVILSGRQVDFDAITTNTATLSTTGGSGTRYLAGLSITATGAVTLNSSGGVISVGPLAAGSLTVASAGAVSFDTVVVTGAATITTTGSNDIGFNTFVAGGNVSLTSGDDIAIGSLSSTGGTVTLNAADDITGTGGGRAALGAGGALSVTAGGDARLAAVSGSTVNLQAATIDAGAVSGAGGITLKATAGGLTLDGLATTGGNASVTASGAVTIDGPVSIAGSYAVTGRGVTLGGTQDATGTVDITATNGSTISSIAGLQLTANSDGVGTEALTLHGGANLGTDSLLRGGPGRQSLVVIDSATTGNFRLGDVDANGLVIAGGAPLAGSLTFGNVTVNGAVNLVVDGGITGTGITSTGGAISLSGGGGATIGTLSASTIDVAMQGHLTFGDFTATAGAAHFASTGGTVTLGSGTATGDIRVEGSAVSVTDAISAGGDYRVRGTTVALGVDNDAELQSAAGVVDIVATSGAIAGGNRLTLRSGSGALILDGAGGIDFGAGVLQAGSTGTGQLGLRAGNGQLIDLGDNVEAGTVGSVDAGHTAIAASLTHNGSLRFGTLDSTGAVDFHLTNGNLTGTALNGVGTVAIDASGGTVDLGALNGTTLTVNGGALKGGSWTASGNAVLTGGTITLVGLDSTGGAASATTSSGTLSIDTAHALTDLVLTANGGDVSVGTASAGGNVSLIALAGNILTDSATAGATLTLKSGGDIRGRSGTSPGLAGTDVVLEVIGNLTTGSITSPGGLSITSGSMNIGSVNAGAALSLTAVSGAMTLGSATARGAISLTATGGIDVGTLTSGGGVTLDSGAALAVHQLTAPGAVTARAGTNLTLDEVQAAGLTSNAASATLGSLTLGTLTLQGGSATIADATVTGATTSNLAGTLTIDTLTGADVTLRAAGITANSLTASGSTTLTSTGGTIDLGQLAGTGAVTLDSAVGVAIDSWQAPAGLTISAIGDVTLGTGTSSLLAVTGRGITITDATVGGAATLTATGALNVQTLRGGNLAFRAASITADSLTATGTTALTSTAGAIDLGQLDSAGAVTLDSATGVSLDTWQAQAGLTVSALGDVALGTGTSSLLAVTGRGITVTDATVGGAATLTASGALNVQALRGGNLAFRGASITADGLTATGTTTLTSTAGAIDLGQLDSTGAVTLDSAQGVSLDSWQAPAGLTVSALGDVALGTGTSSLLAVTGRGITVTDATVTGDATLTASGALDVQALRGGNLAFRAASITADGLTATGTTTLTSTAGMIDLGQLTSAGAITLGSAQGVAIDSWQAPAGMTVTAANAVDLGTGTGSGLRVTAGSIQLADGNLTGDANLTSTGTLGITRLRAANAVLKGGTMTLGMLNLGSLNLSGVTATIADATVSGDATVDLTGALGLDKLTAATATLRAGGTATLGGLTATNALTVRAGDLVLNGTLRAPIVTVGSSDPARGLRLGTAADAGGVGPGLSASEIARIDADRAVFDGGAGDVTIGTLAFGAQTGRSHVDILTTGDLKIVGVVEGDGVGRLFRFGGAATDATTLARTIQILATADAGGRLFFSNADVELRGAKIALGQSGLLDGLFANGGASADQAAALIGNSNSPLYSALAGGSPYVTGEETTLTAARLTVRFNDFALFQNTGTRGMNTGVVLTGSPAGGPALSLFGPGNGTRTAFALFGTINGVGGTSTAILGNTVINANGIDLANARVNGCVLGTAAGCLTTTISQPTLNVFDPGRLVVFRAEADFTLPFDPVLGSNNEALFAGVGSIAEPGAPGIEPQPIPQEQK